MHCNFCNADYEEGPNRCPNCGMRQDYAEPSASSEKKNAERKTIRHNPFAWFWIALMKWGRCKGRATRTEYASFCLLAFVVWLLMFVGWNLIADDDFATAWIPALVGVVLFVPALVAVTVRRLHDMGLSGWFFVVFASVQYMLRLFHLNAFTSILPVVLVFWPPTQDETEFGKNPRYLDD